MKRSYFPRHCWALSGILVVMTWLVACSASAQTPSIEGSYHIVSQQRADGMVLKPPDIMGLCTYTKSHWNFNLVQKDAKGKFRSVSYVATYKLTATEYSETRLFRIINDQIGGQDIVYDLSSETRSVPVTMEGGRIQYKSPFSRASLVFEGNTRIATVEGEVVEVWEKVE